MEAGAFFLALPKFYFSKFGKKIEGRGIITVNYLVLACFFIFLFHSGRELWCFLYLFFWLLFLFLCFYSFLSWRDLWCFFFWSLFLCFFPPGVSCVAFLFIYLLIIFFAFSFLGMSCGAIYLFFGFN